MHEYIENLPVWITLAFLVAFVLIINHIAMAVKEGAYNAGFSKEKTSNMVRFVFFFYFGWFCFVMVLTFLGFISGNTLPPRPILFFTVPLLLFYLLYINRHPDFKIILEKVSLKTLVRIHVFRLIGCFFIILWWNGFIPRQWAFPAGFGDIITAVFSITISWWVIDKKKPVFWLHLWNILGLVDILMVVGLAVLITKWSLEPGAEIQSLVTLTKFPFVMVPAFAPATIIFLHFKIFERIKTFKRTTKD